MNPSVILFAGLTAVAAALAAIVVWAPRRPGVKFAALALTACLLLLGYLGLAELAGRPKFVRDEWLRAHTPEAEVLAFDLREGEAIYLWLRLPGLTEPRAYRLSWELSLARQLQQAAQAAERARTGLAMRLPFAAAQDELEPKFYPLPQPPAPPKEVPAPPLWLPSNHLSGRQRLTVRCRPSRTRSASEGLAPEPPKGGVGARAANRQGGARP